ncbi:MAG: glycosyltransferase family 39 protein [Patescibacteria group bacterium]|jgi:4-amino-4-deoxy-L-arabinose transferase-like glycosyltransferase
MQNLKNFLKNNWPIVAIVALALFLRLFRIQSYMTFLGDEGRDALVWLRMLRHGKLTLIGPQTSIGNMYLGPLFYYLMFPFYVLLGTAGPSIGTALIAGATTFFLWCFGRIWFSEKTGLVSAFLYAVSPVAIVLSHSAWNPNIMPFFALLIIWGIWQFWQKENFRWLIFEGILLSFAVQSHYLGLLLLPVVSLFWIGTLLNLIKSKNNKLKSFLISTVLCLLFFVLLTLGPLVWFDLRHDFINSKAFYKFFSERQATVNFKPYKAVPNLWPLWQMLVTRLLTGKEVLVGFWVSIFLAGASTLSTLLFIARKKVQENLAFVLLVTWLLTGILGMGLYKQHIYDHYFGFLFPVVFLLAGVIFEMMWRFKIWGKVVAFVLLSVLVIFSVKETPLKNPPNFQMQKTAEVSKAIVEISGGKSFNLGLVAKQNYDAGYRYFLEKWGYPPQAIDAQQADATITDQLFVICEGEDCQPIGHPQAEIANFGWAKIQNEWSFPWGTKLYKLVHNRD